MLIAPHARPAKDKKRVGAESYDPAPCAVGGSALACLLAHAEYYGWLNHCGGAEIALRHRVDAVLVNADF